MADLIPMKTLTILGQQFEIVDEKARADIASLTLTVSGLDAGISEVAKSLLITILKAGVYTSDQSANIDALEAALASGGDESVVPDTPEAGITQSGSVLSIVSGVTATQNGSVLAIA